MKFLTVAFGMLLLFFTSNYGQRSQTGLTIGEINNQGGRYVDGVGCPQVWQQGHAQYGGNGYFYMVPSNDGKRALMNLDGKIIRLREIGTNQPRKTRRGSKFYTSYKGGEYTVRVNHTVVKHGESEDGASDQYSITLTVGKGKLVKTINAVGFCGF